MAPTRKSLSFLTLKPKKVSNESTFLYRLSDFSSTINRRRSMRLSSLASNLKNIVSSNFYQLKIKETPSHSVSNRLTINLLCRQVRVALCNNQLAERTIMYKDASCIQLRLFFG